MELVRRAIKSTAQRLWQSGQRPHTNQPSSPLKARKTRPRIITTQTQGPTIADLGWKNSEHRVVLDQAILGLVGAGATTLAPAYDLDVPPGAISGGKMLVAWLYRAHPGEARTLVEAATREICSSNMPVSQSGEEIAFHLERLPGILELNQAQPGHAATIRKLVATLVDAGPTGLKAAAHDLATAHLEICRSTGTLGLSGLDEGAASALLEALFRGLFKARQILEGRRDVLRAYLESHCWQLPTSKPQNDSRSDLDDAVREALVERYAAVGKGRNLIDRCTALSHTLRDDLSQLVARTDGRARKLAAKASKTVTAGDPLTADAALAAIEDINIRTALSDIANVGRHLAQAAHIRGLRGELHETFGDFVRAANHYALAVRHLPRTDHAARWQLAQHQARALELAAQYAGQPGSSNRADQVREAALDILPAWLSELQRDHRPQRPVNAPLPAAEPLSHLLALIEGPTEEMAPANPGTALSQL